MSIIRKIKYQGFLILCIVMPAYSVSALERLPCTALENSKVDESMISKMMAAAKDGYHYRIENDRSKMRFCVDSSTAVVNADFAGGLGLCNKENHTVVSIDANSLVTGKILLANIIKGGRLFNGESYPGISFTSTEIYWINKHEADLKGVLNLHGVKKEVQFYVEVQRAEKDITDPVEVIVKATTTVKLSEFGMDDVSSLVSDKVNLCMSIKTIRYRAH